MMSSDAQQDQMQNLKYQKHLKWNLVSRSSDSGQNYKVSEASEHEVKSRSSNSDRMPSVNSEVIQRHLNFQEITSEARFPDTRRL